MYTVCSKLVILHSVAAGDVATREGSLGTVPATDESEESPSHGPHASLECGRLYAG